MSWVESKERTSRRIGNSVRPDASHVRNLASEFLTYVQSQMGKCCSSIWGIPCFASSSSLFLFLPRSFRLLFLHRHHHLLRMCLSTSFFLHLPFLCHTLVWSSIWIWKSYSSRHLQKCHRRWVRLHHAVCPLRYHRQVVLPQYHLLKLQGPFLSSFSFHDLYCLQFLLDRCRRWRRDRQSFCH